MPIDPVCRMHVPVSREKVSYKGIGYYFCSEHCRRQFMENPEKFAK
jgi:YHS domain-containing protein